jgi:hypothetical protein
LVGYLNLANDGQTGEQLDNVQVHEVDGGLITDLQWAPDRTYFITASKDKTAKVGYPKAKPYLEILGLHH